MRQDPCIQVLVAMDNINDILGTIQQEVRLYGTDDKRYLVARATGIMMNPEARKYRMLCGNFPNKYDGAEGRTLTVSLQRE
eukprot:1172171-Karenia_brevis.AAC.1